MHNGSCPLSPSQAQLWFLHRLNPGATTYNVAWRLRLRGPLDVGALRRALALLAERHEALRTRLVVAGGEPRQLFGEATLPLPMTDLTARPPQERWRAAEQLSDRDARTPFDLEQDRLVRASLVRMAPDDHLLAVTLHHIVADGWSIGVLGEELAVAYGAYAEGRTPELPPVAVRFSDVVREQAATLSGPRLDELLEHWSDALAGAPIVELPTDRPRPAQLSGRGHMLTYEMPAGIASSLRSFSRERQATPFIVLLAAYKALVSRCTRGNDLIVATAFLNRERPELERVVGFLANMLPIRTQLDGDPTFEEAVDAVRWSSLAALAHQELPFGTLVEHLRPRRDLSRNPLVQLGLTYNGGEGVPELPGIEAERIEVDTGAGRLDLHLEAFDTDEGLSFTAEHSADLYETETIARLLRRYEALLADALANPGRRLSELRLMDGDEERAALARGAEVAPAPQEPSVLALFEAHARRCPGAPAVTDGDAALRYGELDARANRLAQHLRAEGVRDGDLVALCLGRGAPVVEAILGILKAGAAYLPLDPSYPAERLGFMVGDAAPAALVTDRAHRDRTGAPHPRTILLDADAERIAARPPVAPQRRDDPRGLAYVMYTSGSTGVPKGVQIEHGNVARLFTATDRWYRFGPSDVWTLFHSYAFDFSVWELWGALAYGGRLVVVPYEASRSPRDFHALAVREGVTVLNQTPTAFAGFMRADLDAERPISTLRYVITGGEALDVAALEPWFRTHGDLEPLFVNMYGITETTVHASYRPVRREDVQAGRSPIGEPIPDLALHLVDEHLRPVPDGVPGELLVAGAGVGRGYLGRDELTAQRFVDDPFAPGRRCYRSGDLGRRAIDGELEYLGRIDDQVQLRGFRIELGEVGAALAAHPAVADAVAAVREEGGDQQLVAYAVFDGEPVDGRELRRFLRDRLPPQAIPARFAAIDRVPMTVNGKVDRRRLPAPPPEPAGELEAAQLPRTPAERRIVAALRAILGAERVGLDDDFFELGGDSLRATRLLADIESGLGCDVPLADFLRDPTARSLARHVATRRRGADRAARVSPLVTLAEPEPGAPVLHLVHPIGGSVLCYQRLAEALRGRAGVRAFRLSSVDGAGAPSVAAVARRYAAKLDPPPDEPLFLGGWSLGGLIAMEMAAQLRERGTPAAFVAALDAPAPGTLGPPTDERAAALEFGQDVAAMLGRPIDAAGTAGTAGVLAAIADGLPELGPDEIERRWRVFLWLHRAGTALAPRPYAEDLLLFTATGGVATAAAWAPLLDGELRHERVEADHYSIVERPAVAAVAATLADAMEGVRQPATGGVAG